LRPRSSAGWRRWGLEIEARHREALHSALMTGVKHALFEGLQGRTAIAKATVDYVHTSVPDALAALKPQPDQLGECTVSADEEDVRRHGTQNRDRRSTRSGEALAAAMGRERRALSPGHA